MHVEDGFWQKVHYNALFGRRKNGKYKISQCSPEVSGAEFAEKEQRKPRDSGMPHTDGVIASTKPVLR
jgi:hypothetical protein